MPIRPDDFDFDPPAGSRREAPRLAGHEPQREQVVERLHESDNRTSAAVLLRPDRIERESREHLPLSEGDASIRRPERSGESANDRPSYAQGDASRPPGSEGDFPRLIKRQYDHRAQHRNWRQAGLVFAFLSIIAALVSVGVHVHRAPVVTSTSPNTEPVSTTQPLPGSGTALPHVNSDANSSSPPPPPLPPPVRDPRTDGRETVRPHSEAIASNPEPAAHPDASEIDTSSTRSAIPASHVEETTSPAAAEASSTVPAAQTGLHSDLKRPSPELLTGGVAPNVYQGPPAGDFVWSGAVEKGQLIEITNGVPSVGSVTGQPLPGVPVSISIANTQIAVVTEPNPLNHFATVVFRTTSKGRIAFGVHWAILPVN